MERVRRRDVSRAIGVALALELIGNGAGIALELVTSRSYGPRQIAAAVVAAGVLVGLAVALRANARLYDVPAGRVTRGVPVTLAVIQILLLCGVGGAAATYGIQVGVREARLFLDPAGVRGTERLTEPQTQVEGPLVITVTSVEINARSTVVRMLAANSGDEPLRLPVAGFTEFALPDGTVFAGIARTSRWPEEIPPGRSVRGFVVFDGVPGRPAVVASVAFTQVFSDHGPRSIRVQLRLAELTVR